MDKMLLKKNCYRLFKLSVVFSLVLFIYFKWSTNRPQDRLPVKVIQKNGNYLVVEAAENLTQWDSNIFLEDKKQYDLRIITIVYNRLESILRLLDSINNAEYYNDQIKLEVWIDRSKTGIIDEKTVNATKGFSFKHGNFSVHQQATHVGIFGQWLGSWKPEENSSEIAIILEDDCIVSPLFYKYLKLVHHKYDHLSSINGYALQGISIKHSGVPGFLEAPYENHVFVYPVLGTWGFSPNKRNWIKFLSWFRSVHSDKHFKPYVPKNIATTWYKQFETMGKQTGMWSMWHIYFAWKNNEHTLYGNFKGHKGLTANMKEAGLHYGKGDSKQSNPLLTSWKPEYDKLPDFPVQLNLDGVVVKD